MFLSPAYNVCSKEQMMIIEDKEKVEEVTRYYLDLYVFDFYTDYFKDKTVRGAFDFAVTTAVMRLTFLRKFLSPLWHEGKLNYFAANNTAKEWCGYYCSLCRFPFYVFQRHLSCILYKPVDHHIRQSSN